MKKTVSAIALILAVLLALGACAPAGETEPPDGSPASSPTPEPLPSPAVPYTPTRSDLRSADEMELMEVFTPQTLPASTELPVGSISVDFRSSPRAVAANAASVTRINNVVYDTVNGQDLSMIVLLPEGAADGDPLPLVVYIPGGAWLMADPAMAAIRFMRANAAEYNIDPDRVAVWGASAGGHLATFVGVTGDDMFTEGRAYPEYSSSVSAVIDEYGPIDITLIQYYPSTMADHISPNSPSGLLIGRRHVLENWDLAQTTNPMNHIGDNPIPPFLMMHGSADGTVPFNQSVRLYERLREYGHDVTFYKLEGDGHGTGGFMSRDALEIIVDFLNNNI